MKKIAFAVFLLCALLPLHAFAGGTYPVCKDAVSADIGIHNKKVELNLKPNCWSGEITVDDSVETLGSIYVGKGEARCLCLPIVTKIDGHVVNVERGNKFRLRGNGKITIFITRYAGMEI